MSDSKQTSGKRGTAARLRGVTLAMSPAVASRASVTYANPSAAPAVAPNATIGGHKSAYKAEWGGNMRKTLTVQKFSGNRWRKVSVHHSNNAAARALLTQAVLGFRARIKELK